MVDDNPESLAKLTA